VVVVERERASLPEATDLMRVAATRAGRNETAVAAGQGNLTALIVLGDTTASARWHASGQTAAAAQTENVPILHAAKDNVVKVTRRLATANAAKHALSHRIQVVIAFKGTQAGAALAIHIQIRRMLESDNLHSWFTVNVTGVAASTL